MGWLKGLFKKPELEPVDLSVLKTDMHSHLIPGIDDGSQSMEESIQLIRGMQALGYKKLITTPHINYDYYPNTPEIIRSGLAALQAELKRQEIAMDIEIAAEYYVDYSFFERLNKTELLTFGKNYLLIEFSYYNELDNIDALIFELQLAKVNLIVAHPERYVYWHKNFSKYEKLKEKGVLFQLNMNSLSGFYSEQVQKMAEKLIEAGMIDFVGSDLHKAPHLEALQKSARTKAMHDLMASGKLKNTTL